MAKSITAAVAILQSYASHEDLGTAKAKDAPSSPTENAGGFPFSVCYVGTAKITGESAQSRKDIVVLYLDYHISRNLLPSDVNTALAFYAKFPDFLIDDPTLGNTVDTIMFDQGIEAQFGELTLAKTKTIGWRFKIPVKIRTVISV